MTLNPYMTGDLMPYTGTLDDYATGILQPYATGFAGYDPVSLTSPLDQAIQYVATDPASGLIAGGGGMPGFDPLGELGNQLVKKGVQKAFGYGMDQLGIPDLINSGWGHFTDFLSGTSNVPAGSAEFALFGPEAGAGAEAAGLLSNAGSLLPALGFGLMALQVGQGLMTGSIPDPLERASLKFDPVTGDIGWSSYSQDGGNQQIADEMKAYFQQAFDANPPDLSWYEGTDPLEINLTRDLKQRGAFYPYVQGGPIAYSQGTDTRGQPVGLEGRQYMGGIGPTGLNEYNDNPSYSGIDPAITAILSWLGNPNATSYDYLTDSQARQDARADGGMMVQGPGDGRDDGIDAKLSDGEYIFPADVVSALGRGSGDAGADILDGMVEKIRAQYREHLGALPPPRR